MSVAVQRYLVVLTESSQKRRQGLIDLLHGSGRQFRGHHDSRRKRKAAAVKEPEPLWLAVFKNSEIVRRQTRNQAAGAVFDRDWQLDKIHGGNDSGKLRQIRG